MTCRLTELPVEICELASLRNLDMSTNEQIADLPDCIGRLTNLELLNLSANAIMELPMSMSRLLQLADLNLCRNRLACLPAQLSCLQQLQRLQLDENRLRSIPSDILKGCQSLHTISVHKNPITIEQLRDTPAFQEFDVRRRAKYSKQVRVNIDVRW